MTKTIEYDDGSVSARLVVCAATVRMGLERQALKGKAREDKDTSASPLESSLLRLFTYPDLMAVTKGDITIRERSESMEADYSSNFPISDLSFEGWLDLPEPLVMEWEQTVYELNPHWKEQYRKLGEALSGNGAKLETNSVAAFMTGIDDEKQHSKTQ